MFKTLKRTRYLILTFMIALAIIIGLGYLFAEKRSEPVYLSKIDRLMFENKNKSPRFVLTLPDKKFVRKTGIREKVEDTPATNTEMTNDEMVKKFLMSLPILASLPEEPGLQPLEIIELKKDMIEEKNDLLLPKIAKNGDKPWVEYGVHKEVQPNFYRVAIVLKNVGFDSTSANQIFKVFPSEVAISFTPYAQNLKQNIIDARKAGHETYVDWFLPSKDVMRSDTGPLAMSLTVSAEENLRRLQKTIATGAPIGGIVIDDGFADKDNAEQLQKSMEELKNRGLLLIDATHGEGLNTIKRQGLARSKADVVIDQRYYREYVQNKIIEAENVAMDKGYVLIVAEPKPVVLKMLSEWIKTFSPQLNYEQLKEQGKVIEKPFALVPASNIVVE